MRPGEIYARHLTAAAAHKASLLRCLKPLVTLPVQPPVQSQVRLSPCRDFSTRPHALDVGVASFDLARRIRWHRNGEPFPDSEQIGCYIEATALATQLVVRGLCSAEPVLAEAWRGHGADRRDLSGRWYETGQSIGGTLHGGKR